MLELLKKLTKVGNSTSPANTLDKVDAKKLGVDAVCVGLSAALSYAIAHLGSLDIGTTTAILVPFIDMALSAALKFIRDNGPVEAK